MSFQDVVIKQPYGTSRPRPSCHRRGLGPNSNAWNASNSAAQKSAKNCAILELKIREKRDSNHHRDRSSPRGEMLYGRMKMVPSASFDSESSETHEDDEEAVSLEFSSCSEAHTSVTASSNGSFSRVSTSSQQTSASFSSHRGQPGFATRQQPSGRNQIIPPTDKRIRRKGEPEEPRSSGRRKNKKGQPKASSVSKRDEIPVPFDERPSPFSELSSEILHFQKMVAGVESLLEDGPSSPETQWRSRILVRSAQDADRDIGDKLHRYEKSLAYQDDRESRTALAAYQKLQRDYVRVHKLLGLTLYHHERRQRAEVAMLGNPRGTVDGDHDLGTPLVVRTCEEDFFERAMREREQEVHNIKQKMGKVNDIYQELATLVDGQQEQIDTVEDNIQGARDKVEGGLRHIEHARDQLCAVGNDMINMECGEEDDDDGGDSSPVQQNEDTSLYERLYPSSLGQEEIFHWSMPFPTFHKDITSVQKDMFGMGSDMASRIPKKMSCIACCADDDSALFSSYDEGEIL